MSETPAQTLTTFVVENFTSVAESNAQRAEDGKNLALIVYAVAGLSHVLMSLEVALVIAWRVPASVLSQMPYAQDVRVATFYWWYASLSISFLISCAGGTLTMVVIIFLYAFMWFYIILDALCNCRARCTERNRPPDRGGRSLQAQERIDWLISGGVKGDMTGGFLGLTGGSDANQKEKNEKKKKDEAERTNTSNANLATNISFYDMEKIKVFEPLLMPTSSSPSSSSPTTANNNQNNNNNNNNSRLPQKDQKSAFEKVANIIKLSRQGTDDKKKPWSYYPDRNPDGSASDTQIALEEAAAWKVRRAFGDRTETTSDENGGQLRDADSGVIVGSLMETAMRLARMLMRYSPGSLPNMEQILESYKLQEDRLFKDLEGRYGPEPTRLERKKWLVQQRARSGMTVDEIAKTFTVPELPSELYWTRCPVQPVAPQLAAMIVCGFFIILCAIGMFSAVMWWPISEYRVIRDFTTTSGQKYMLSQPEKKPDMTAKAEFLIYGWPGTASEMRVQQYLNLVSKRWYSYIFYVKLETDQEKKDWIFSPWIEGYGVDMSSYYNQSYLDYVTPNDWFTRRIRVGARTLSSGWNTTGSILVPCDGRYVAYGNLQRARKFWIKGGRFTYEELLDGTHVQNNPRYFTGGSILIGRLAIADYHHFHSPVSGKIVDMFRVKKHYFSNTPTAVHSGNNVFYNERWVLFIDTAGAAQNIEGISGSPAKNVHQAQAPPNLGVVAVVVVGSTLAGSVQFGHRNFSSNSCDFNKYPMSNGGGSASTACVGPSKDLKIGTNIKAGDELGFFELGGSTLVMFFRVGAASFLCDVMERSASSVETVFQLGNKIGINRGTVNENEELFCPS